MPPRRRPGYLAKANIKRVFGSAAAPVHLDDEAEEAVPSEEDTPDVAERDVVGRSIILGEHDSVEEEEYEGDNDSIEVSDEEGAGTGTAPHSTKKRPAPSHLPRPDLSGLVTPGKPDGQAPPNPTPPPAPRKSRRLQLLAPAPVIDLDGDDGVALPVTPTRKGKFATLPAKRERGSGTLDETADTEDLEEEEEESVTSTTTAPKKPKSDACPLCPLCKKEFDYGARHRWHACSCGKPVCGTCYYVDLRVGDDSNAWCRDCGKEYFHRYTHPIRSEGQLPWRPFTIHLKGLTGATLCIPQVACTDTLADISDRERRRVRPRPISMVSDLRFEGLHPLKRVIFAGKQLHPGVPLLLQLDGIGVTEGEEWTMHLVLNLSGD